MKLAVYQARGFYCLDNVAPAGLVKLAAAAVAIKKGDYLTDDTNGYATNTASEASLIFYGIAAEDVDNSSGSSGDLNVLVIPYNPSLRFSVPVGNDAVIVRTDCGLAADLHNAYSVDVADSTIPTGGIALWLEDFDACAEAVDGNTYGYAIGRFRIFAP